MIPNHGLTFYFLPTLQFLVSELGFRDVRNVTGGIDAFSLADKSVPRY